MKMFNAPVMVMPDLSLTKPSDQRRLDIDSTLSRRIDVESTSIRGPVLSGKQHNLFAAFFFSAEWEQAMKRQGFSTDDDTDLYDSEDEEEEEEEEDDEEEEGVEESLVEEERPNRKNR